MRLREVATALASIFAIAALASSSGAQTPYRDPNWPQLLQEAAAKPTPRIGGHPDLTGTWTGALPTFPVKRSADGSIQIISNGGRPPPKPANAPPPPPPNNPSYKPEFQAKWQEMHDMVTKIDKVFYCGMPGVPRLGAPSKIIQTPKEMILLYSVLSGDTWRIIPTDGRGFPKDSEPKLNGDAIGHWEGDTFVIEGQNFSDESWFGSNAYFHSDKMRVTERLRRQGDTLTYDFTVEDPGVLTKPWTPAKVTILRTDEQLENALACMDVAGPELLDYKHE